MRKANSIGNIFTEIGKSDNNINPLVSDPSGKIMFGVRPSDITTIVKSSLEKSDITINEV
ncbi:hypothetical protein LJB90_03625 [Eubacteriales bacterium OttesenSCG-928-G02]|nr:hypothetical protein [Eubacteriales bacterium OttesenSCG-928-G02]